jgi:hypothetical protein
VEFDRRPKMKASYENHGELYPSEVYPHEYEGEPEQLSRSQRIERRICLETRTLPWEDEHNAPPVDLS